MISRSNNNNSKQSSNTNKYNLMYISPFQDRYESSNENFEKEYVKSSQWSAEKGCLINVVRDVLGGFGGLFLLVVRSKRGGG